MIVYEANTWGETLYFPKKSEAVAYVRNYEWGYVTRHKVAKMPPRELFCRLANFEGGWSEESQEVYRKGEGHSP